MTALTRRIGGRAVRGTAFLQALSLRLRGHVVRRFPPNYAFIEDFRPGEAAVDIGPGNDPDFSSIMVERYNLATFAVDPTRRHAAALHAAERRWPRFHYVHCALGAESGTAEFYESDVNVSGSLLPGHRNVLHDPVSRYTVPVVTLEQLFSLVNRPVAIVKMDTEGVEYQVLAAVQRPTLRRVRQMIVEFHHDFVAGLTWKDTRDAIRRARSLGMRSIVYNGRDCLFYWPDLLGH